MAAPEEKKDDAKDKTPEKKADASLKETKEDNTVVLVGDSDMIYDGFSVRRMNGPFGADRRGDEWQFEFCPKSRGTTFRR